MFENLIASIKVTSMKVAESFWKERANNNIVEVDNIASTSTSPVSVEVNPLATIPSSTYSTPRGVDLKWPVLFNNEMHWLPSVPQVDDREDVIDRFDSISFVPPTEKVRSVRSLSYLLGLAKTMSIK